jgi:hypothetical protein
MPIAAGSAVDNEHSASHAIKEFTRRRPSLLPRPKITAREPGVTLDFLEQFCAENEIIDRGRYRERCCGLTREREASHERHTRGEEWRVCWCSFRTESGATVCSGAVCGHIW